MPLSLAPLNVELEIIKMLLEEKERKHLESLGLTIGSKIRILDSNNGNLILLVKNCRLALDKSVATKILVR